MKKLNKLQKTGIVVMVVTFLLLEIPVIMGNQPLFITVPLFITGLLFVFIGNILCHYKKDKLVASVRPRKSTILYGIGVSVALLVGLMALLNPERTTLRSYGIWLCGVIVILLILYDTYKSVVKNS